MTTIDEALERKRLVLRASFLLCLLLLDGELVTAWVRFRWRCVLWVGWGGG